MRILLKESECDVIGIMIRMIRPGFIIIFCSVNVFMIFFYRMKVIFFCSVKNTFKALGVIS